ncbi:hypothetical protein CN275_00530 [Bacillus anthracis]|nr:hypothetical protein CN275_00530 [Bacillus anthracis]PFR03841.1 hypothetical protein COK10_25130 [Bacillus anthracis]
MLMKKPKIFVSSTIYDFSDLRSAIKYFLNEYGFEVQMSEYNDFEKDLNENSYNACLKAIEGCDYYLLLIGSRVGGYYDKNNRISITQKEYKHAYELSKSKRIKILSFVRRDIWNFVNDLERLKKFLLEEYVTEKGKLDENDVAKITNYKEKDAGFISSFINEVTRKDEMKNGISNMGILPTNNWIHQFSNFEEIIQTLVAELNIKKNMDYNLHSIMVSKEIMHNFKYLTRKIEGEMYSCVDYHGKCFSELSKKLESIKHSGKLFLSKECINELKNYLKYFVFIKDYLNMGEIEKAIQSGAFLDYSKDDDCYKASSILERMINLRDCIKTLKTHDLQVTQLTWNLNQSLQGEQNSDGEFMQEYITELFELLLIFSYHFRVFELSECILKFFQTGTLPNKELTPFFENVTVASSFLSDEEILSKLDK